MASFDSRSLVRRLLDLHERACDAGVADPMALAKWMIRFLDFGRLREGGFAVLATFDHPHFTLVLADLSELTLARLERCFDAPIPNPGRRPEG